jgi:hypothetical protein
VIAGGSGVFANIFDACTDGSISGIEGFGTCGNGSSIPLGGFGASLEDLAVRVDDLDLCVLLHSVNLPSSLAIL